MKELRRWFCAGFLFTKVEGIWYSLGVTDLRFPNEVKPIGGSDKKDKDPKTTMDREGDEETTKQGETKGRLSIVSCTKVHEDLSNRDHSKIFYLITKAVLKIEPGEEINVIEPDGQLLVVRLWELQEFSTSLFWRNYGEAFKKTCAEMRRLDPTFPSVP